MTTLYVHSDTSLQKAIGSLREEYRKHSRLKVTVRESDGRSLDQNALSHAFYEQVSTELAEDSPLAVKCEAKLHCGVPILRAEDEDFRGAYDLAIKGLSYEQKLEAMKFWPVTSLMTKRQLGAYLEAMQSYYLKRGVVLEFPISRFDMAA